MNMALKILFAFPVLVLFHMQWPGDWYWWQALSAGVCAGMISSLWFDVAIKHVRK